MNNIIDIDKGKKVETIPTLTKGNIPHSGYFVKSKYKDRSGKLNKCYEENDLTINI